MSDHAATAPEPIAPEPIAQPTGALPTVKPRAERLLPLRPLPVALEGLSPAARARILGRPAQDCPITRDNRRGRADGLAGRPPEAEPSIAYANGYRLGRAEHDRRRQADRAACLAAVATPRLRLGVPGSAPAEQAGR